ncbi:unnamed protein product, partial [Brassica oleracea]
LDKLTTYVSNLGINEHSNKNVSTIKETMACQAEFHVPDLDCLRLVVDILIIAEDKNYLTCIEGFPNTYLMLAESKNPNHELHVRAKA